VTPPTAIKSSGNCPVCGEPLGPAPVTCPECNTPHHWDCWEYNGGCAIFGCPRKIKPRDTGENAQTASTDDARETEKVPSPKLPDKIPFPRLSAGTFLGVFFVTLPTVVVSLVCEVLALVAWLSDKPSFQALFFLGIMLLSLLWAAITAEIYNIDLKGKRISKSKHLLNWEIFEWQIIPLAEVSSLELQPVITRSGPMIHLVAKHTNGGFTSLTPPFVQHSADEYAITSLLHRLQSGSMIPLGRAARRRIEMVRGRDAQHKK